MAEIPASSTIRRTLPSVQGKTTTLLSAVTATGSSSAVENAPLNKVLQVFGTFVGTIHFEGSNDNSNFVSLGNVTAAGKIANAEAWKYVRARVSAYTSGSITAILGV